MDKSHFPVTKTKAISIAIFGIAFVLILLTIFTTTLYVDFGIKSMINVMIVLYYLIFLIAIIGYIERKRVIQILRKYRDIIKIEDSLISAGIYIGRGAFLEVPTISIEYESNEIIISIQNLFFRKKLESIADIISSALPNSWICRRYYMDKGENNLIVEYSDITRENRIVVNDVNELYFWCGDELVVDKNISFNLEEYPHILITGTTGSGKTYFAQTLIIQAVLNAYHVAILDIKGTYLRFRNNCCYADTIEDIRNELIRTIVELHDRKRAMRKRLESDPNCTALQCGYNPYLVVFEEYLAFCNSGVEKKVLVEVEKMLLEITTTGRQFGIHLMIITQVSSANSLSTSLRANLSAKFLLGTADETILKTTFGLATSTAYRKKMEKGEGLCSFDIEIIPFKSMTINIINDELDELLRSAQNPCQINV